MTKSAGYLLIFLIAIAFIWGCNADTHKPAEEKIHIDNSSNVIKQKANDDLISSYADEKHKKDKADSISKAVKIEEAKKPRLDFSAKINEKMPEFNFKIIGKIKGEYFQPSHVKISDTANSFEGDHVIGFQRFDHLAVLVVPGCDINKNTHQVLTKSHEVYFALRLDFIDIV